MLYFSFFLVDFSIQVLSSGAWPYQQGVVFQLPSEVCIDLKFPNVFYYMGSKLANCIARHLVDMAVVLGAAWLRW